MKIKEEILYDNLEDKIIVKKTHDFSTDLDRISQLRQICGEEQKGAEKKLVAAVPLDVMAQWCKEAGVSWDDSYARGEVIKKRLKLAENSKFRIWKGKY